MDILLSAKLSTDPEELDKLAGDSDWRVRSYVAENKNTSVETLDKLAEDSNLSVRYYVAKNGSTRLSLHISYNCFPADADWSLNGAESSLRKCGGCMWNGVQENAVLGKHPSAGCRRRATCA